MLAWRGNGISFQREVDCRHGLASLGEIAWGNSPCGGHRDEAMVIYGELDGRGLLGKLDGNWKMPVTGRPPYRLSQRSTRAGVEPMHGRIITSVISLGAQSVPIFFPVVWPAESPRGRSGHNQGGQRGGSMDRSS